MFKRQGFTLAEVLITLGIIGVVAAMTIPSLMNQTGGAEFKTGFKKAMSVINQAITMTCALEGTDFSTLTSGTGAGSVYAMFTSRMSILRTGADTTIGGPFTAAANYTLFFTDGMAITFPTAMAACTADGQANCRIAVDVNGVKRPNVVSTATNDTTKTGIKDQFVLNVYNQMAVPHSTREDYIMYNQ